MGQAGFDFDLTIQNFYLNLTGLKFGPSAVQENFYKPFLENAQIGFNVLFQAMEHISCKLSRR